MPPPPGKENNTHENQVVTKIKPELSAMPEEILAQIINSMSIESIAELALTSKKMNAIVKNHRYYTDVKVAIENQLEAKIMGLLQLINGAKSEGAHFNLEVYNTKEFVDKLDTLGLDYIGQKHKTHDIKMSEQYQNLLKLFISTQKPSNILCFAASGGLHAIIPDLIEFGCNINEQSSASLTPLYYAICCNQVITLKILIQYGADLKPKNYSSTYPTPLIHALSKKQTLIAKTLIVAGADVNTADSNGNTPLMHALDLTMVNDATDIISTLVTHGANLFARNKKNMTALEIARDRGLVACTHVLMKYRNEHYMNEHEKIISEYQPGSEQKNLEGMNTAFNFEKKVQRLLKLLESMTYMPAEYYSEINETKDRIEGYLIVDTDIWSSEYKYSRIHHAILKDYKRAIKTLAKKKYICSQYGYHAIHFAAYLGQDDIFEDLVKAGANINRLTKSQETPLAIAAINGSQYVVGTAIRLNATITFQAMKNAILSSSSGILLTLIKAHRKINIRDENGNTLLMIAIMEKKYQIAADLINSRIDVNAINIENESALTYAINLYTADIETRHYEEIIINKLIEAGAKPMIGDHLDEPFGSIRYRYSSINYPKNHTLEQKPDSSYHLFLNRNTAIAALGTGLGIGMALGLTHVSSLGIITLNMGNIAAVSAVASVVVYACITLALYSYHTHLSPEQQASCFAGLKNMLRFSNSGQNETQNQDGITMRPLNTLSVR